MSLRLHPFILLVLLPSIFTAAALSAGPHLFEPRDSYKPLHRLDQRHVPFFFDDMDIESLIKCAQHQAAFLEKQNPRAKILFGSDHYTTAWLLHSIQELLRHLRQKPDSKELNRFLHANYLVYEAGGRPKQQGRRMLVTGYYEPVFSGCLTRQQPFVFPIYSLPKSLVVLPGGKSGSSKTGRYDGDNRFVPYWTRAEIEQNNLLLGEELAFLRDPFDAFLLHVQGSGRIQLPDHSIRSVRFAGSNGLEYRSIGKLLVDEKIMTLAEVTVPAIRTYLENNPEQRQRILQHNPRYIFFSWGDALAPRGSSGERLTPGRSIAMDASVLPGGTIGYLLSRRPVNTPDGNISSWKTLSRFVFPQDSGAAIKGTGRVDLFWGSGDYAELAANHMKEEGQLYFLVKKGFPGTKHQ
jgi:membrane-bound lytic murein transglycosylase A